MSRFLEKVGVSIASRLGITVGIAAIVAALLGGGYWWVKSQAPRETVKDKETGLKLDIEQLSFYGAKDSLVNGTVYRPSDILDEKLPCVIYCQDKTYGDGWCRSLAGTGIVAYCFDFQGMVKRPASRIWKPSSRASGTSATWTRTKSISWAKRTAA